MSDVISFPGLGWEFTINRVAFSLGNMDIYWYAVLIAGGFLLAVWFFEKNCPKFGLDADKSLDVIFITMIFGIIGARAYFVIFKWKELYADNPMEIFNIRGGGLGFYGGIIGGILGIWLGCRIFKVKVLPFLDLAGGAVLIGQGIGRWGNFVNSEAFGCNTTLPWGMTSRNIVRYILSHTAEEMGTEVSPLLPVHPTFLYESLWCGIGLLLFCIFMKKRVFDGEMILFYIGWNGMGRAWIEGLRTDSLMLGTFRVSQLLGGMMAVFAFGALWVIHRKIQQMSETERPILWRDRITEKAKDNGSEATEAENEKGGNDNGIDP